MIFREVGDDDGNGESYRDPDPSTRSRQQHGLVSKAELEKVYAGKEAAGKTPEKAKKKKPELEKESA